MAHKSWTYSRIQLKKNYGSKFNVNVNDNKITVLNAQNKPESYDFVHRVNGEDIYMVIESELHLLQMHSWSADGTFRGVSLLQEYSQIYIISIIKQLPEGICYFPIMISILQKKDKGLDEYDMIHMIWFTMFISIF